MRICDFPGCGRKHHGGGLCKTHGEQFRSGKKLVPITGNRQWKRCQFPGCGRKHSARGYCGGHYEQFRIGAELKPLQNTAKARDELGRKNCSGCREWLPEDCFGVARSRSDGLNHACKRCTHIALRHNMTVEWYELAAESGCEICGRKDNLHIDHDHACCGGSYSCGKCVRGLLCSECNNGIGRFGDDTDLMSVAIGYIVKHRA